MGVSSILTIFFYLSWIISFYFSFYFSCFSDGANECLVTPAVFGIAMLYLYPWAFLFILGLPEWPWAINESYYWILYVLPLVYYLPLGFIIGALISSGRAK
jgi:hypothetical protein